MGAVPTQQPGCAQTCSGLPLRVDQLGTAVSKQVLRSQRTVRAVLKQTATKEAGNRKDTDLNCFLLVMEECNSTDLHG